jgi:hypothetical protein
MVGFLLFRRVIIRRVNVNKNETVSNLNGVSFYGYAGRGSFGLTCSEIESGLMDRANHFRGGAFPQTQRHIAMGAVIFEGVTVLAHAEQNDLIGADPYRITLFFR